MVQEVLIGLIFLAALGFLGSLLIRSFQAKDGCETGCGKCSPADFKALEITPKEKRN